MGTIVNRALPSLHGGSIEITLTVPLEKQNYSFPSYIKNNPPLNNNIARRLEYHLIKFN